MNHAQDAKRTLFHLGHELPGRRLRQFAIDLLLATRDHPGAPPEELIDHAVSVIEDGPTALVAEEPDLRRAPLDPPARTVEEAATAAVKAVGHQLIAAYRRP
jgi:hypothetical protein